MPASTRRSRSLAGALATLLAASTAHAQVNWTDWTSSTATTVTGTLTAGATPVGVTYTGPYYFRQLDCSPGNGDYWTPYASTYLPNAPTNCEMIALGDGGTNTIAFSSTVTNPYFALVSWNLNPNVPVTFNGPVEVINSGPGNFGSGTMTVMGNSIYFSGEVHGTFRLLGNYDSITFTDQTEYWHGFTVGAEGLAATATTPEPSTYVLFASGLLGVVGMARRRRRVN